MEVRFATNDLEQIDADLTAGLPADAVETFDDVIQHIWASEDERDLLSPRWLEVRQDGLGANSFSVALSRLYRLELELSGEVVHVRGLVNAQGGEMSYG